MTVAVGKYYEWALQNRQSLISKQQGKGTAIFWIVVTLVGLGMLFSSIQFHLAIKAARMGGPGLDHSTSTTFKASLSGVEVTSSILGVVILVISLAVFYLYLMHVFPITVLDR